MNDGRWMTISGRHPVLEVLTMGRKVREIVIAEGTKGANVDEIISKAKRARIKVSRVPRKDIDRNTESNTHQGVVAYIRPVEYADLDRVLKLPEKGQGLFVVAAGIEDPHNLGALIRSANAAGAHGVIVGKHRAVGLNETVVKASAGAALYTPVVQVTNIAHTLDVLKQEGYWVVGTSSDADQTVWDMDLKGDIVIVVGSEGKGISRLILERCDFRASIPMFGAVSSLNASVAGALFLYEAQRQRQSRS